MKKIFISIFSLIFCANLFAQDPSENLLRGFTPPDEIVTFSASLPFNKAIEILSDISLTKKGVTIVSQVERTDPIGIELPNIHYEKALLIITQAANLLIERTPRVIVIKQKEAVVIEPKTYASVNSREVKISAVFFELDITNFKERGMNWELLMSQRDFSIGGGVKTTATESEQQGSATGGINAPDGKITTTRNFSVGGMLGEFAGLIRFLESENLGEVIASPSIIVRDRIEGRIQVGSDFSIKQRDFAGNVVEQFFSTGSIIRVIPYIYTEEGVPYILVNLDVERSSGFPSELSTEIKKTQAKTQVLMLDGEETVIGGLFVNDEKVTRVGIPGLKDLPWWVFGLRYLFGSDRITVSKKELIILIKVDLVPTLKERLAFPQLDGAMQEELSKQREKIQMYKLQTLTKPTDETEVKEE